MDKTESEKQEWNLETRNQNGSPFYPWLPDLFFSFASYVSRFLDSFLSAFFRNTSTGSETRSIPTRSPLPIEIESGIRSPRNYNNSLSFPGFQICLPPAS
jgi:hypothetical protein